MRFNPKIILREKNGFVTEKTVWMLHAKQGKQKHDVRQHVGKWRAFHKCKIFISVFHSKLLYKCIKKLRVMSSTCCFGAESLLTSASITQVKNSKLKKKPIKRNLPGFLRERCLIHSTHLTITMTVLPFLI